ncbi:Gfo/Idh/MocA family oxidoreductase [Fredinandcohnia sp. SECRCQ15]|uniref:Gfo/Idh/MocA family oxidoreductase n=2 Tax=Fredinandcohnia quinoae TaxID=2918902 RepID=A0AAW5E8D1_9BACI|nr:Gfo/Idh/MocA family oxidoreductase [Fredinandcohnia sp. SECRCQ15]
MTIRFGLIGCGFISKKHLYALLNCDRAQLVALSDIQQSRMEESINYYQMNSDSLSTIECYTNYQDMLGNEEVDAVIICSYSGLHAKMAKEALLSQKHVVLEKPMALSLAESNELITLAQAQKKELMVCHQLRFRPIMQKIKQIIDEGKIGKPILGVASIRINRTQSYYMSTSWRGKWESDGGMLINQGIHVVDLLQWFLGDVKTVYGEIGQQSFVKETEDVALGIIQFKNQAKGIIESNIVTKPNNLGYSLSIFGEKGTISLDGPSLNNITRWFVEGDETTEEELECLVSDGNEEIYMYENFIEAVNSNNKHVLIDGLEGKKALELIFAIYKSELSKQVVQCPITSFSTADMKRKEG